MTLVDGTAPGTTARQTLKVTHSVPVNRTVTRGDAVFAAVSRANTHVGGGDSQWNNNIRHERITADVAHHTPVGVLHEGDSVPSGAARPANSFVDAAALAKTLVVRDGDSQATRESVPTVQADGWMMSLPSVIAKALLPDRNTFLSQRHLVRDTTAAALASRGGRDRGSDSSAQERWVREHVDEQRGALLRNGSNRRARDESSRSLHGTERKTGTLLPGTAPTIPLGESDSRDITDITRRTYSLVGDFLSAMSSTVSRLVGGTDTTQYTETRVQPSMIPHFLGSAPPSRKMRDDTLTRAYSPLGGGGGNTPISLGTWERSSGKKETASRTLPPRHEAVAVVPSRPSAMHQNGHRET